MFSCVYTFIKIKPKGGYTPISSAYLMEVYIPEYSEVMGVLVVRIIICVVVVPYFSLYSGFEV